MKILIYLWMFLIVGCFAAPSLGRDRFESLPYQNIPVPEISPRKPMAYALPSGVRVPISRTFRWSVDKFSELAQFEIITYGDILEFFLENLPGDEEKVFLKTPSGPGIYWGLAPEQETVPMSFLEIFEEFPELIFKAFVPPKKFASFIYISEGTYPKLLSSLTIQEPRKLGMEISFDPEMLNLIKVSDDTSIFLVLFEVIQPVKGRILKSYFGSLECSPAFDEVLSKRQRNCHD